MRRVLAALDRHWFAPASLRDLALVRILVFGTQTLVFLPSLAFQLNMARAEPFLYQPIAALRLLLAPVGGLAGDVRPSAQLLTVTWGVALVAGLLATVGLWARPAMIAAAVANTLLVAHGYSYGEYHHPEALMIIALAVLAAAPSAEAWSVDAARRRAADGAPSALSPYARWPLRLMQWLLALTYLSAGASKLARGGVEWFNGYTLAYHFATDYLHTGSSLAMAAASLPPWVLVPVSAGAVLLELTFAVAILVPRTAWLYVLAGAAMHVGIYFIQHAPFFQTIVLYCVFVESLRLYWPRRLRVRVPRVTLTDPLTSPPTA